jgi:hypothetical protein
VTCCLALLADATGDDALRLQARLLVQRQDWHGAVHPLSVLFGRLPPHGPLDAAQGAVALQFVAASLRDGAPVAAARGIGTRLTDASERRSLAILLAPASPQTVSAGMGAASGI